MSPHCLNAAAGYISVGFCFAGTAPGFYIVNRVAVVGAVMKDRDTWAAKRTKDFVFWVAADVSGWRSDLGFLT